MAANTKDLLSAHGLAPSKKRGQNFLKNRSTAARIVSRAGFLENDQIVEVGVGLGALTLCLAERVARIIGIEIDRGIVAYLEETKVLPDNVELVHADILKFDFNLLFKKVGQPLKIISNLPYSISNPFIFKLIDNRILIDRVVILLQKEMAERLSAVPHTKDYGIPSVLLQSCAEVRPLMGVAAAEFHPRPKVDSQLIEIQFNPERIAAPLFASLRSTVRSAFSSRRKTLINNLTSSLPPELLGSSDKSQKRMIILKGFEMQGLRADIRAENLSVDEFIVLAEYLMNRK